MLNKKINLMFLVLSLVTIMTACKKDIISMVVPYGGPQFCTTLYAK